MFNDFDTVNARYNGVARMTVLRDTSGNSNKFYNYYVLAESAFAYKVKTTYGRMGASGITRFPTEQVFESAASASRYVDELILKRLSASKSDYYVSESTDNSSKFVFRMPVVVDEALANLNFIPEQKQVDPLLFL